MTIAPERGNCVPPPGASDAERKQSVDRMFATRAADVGEAKRVCAGCPIRSACYEEAVLRREEHGVWGGVSFPAEARALRRIEAQVAATRAAAEALAS